MKKTCLEPFDFTQDKLCRRIAVTGGKGGTGKSTLAILLANKLRSQNKSVVLCDCDVECPNDYLLLGEELEEPVERVYAKYPKLDKEKCTKCGLCVKNCRSNAIFQPKNQYPIFLHELCSGCGLCWNLCPFGAIEIERRVTGEIFINKLKTQNSKLNNFWLVTGKSIGVVDETGPIVTETRKFAEKFAKEVEADYLLLDSAPGMHCSVIRALIDVDLAYAVTEPTPLGAHDLELILKLLKKLKVPARIILNQSDLGKREEIDKIVKESGVEIEYEIPYSKEIVRAYSKGKLGEINLLSAN